MRCIAWICSSDLHMKNHNNQIDLTLTDAGSELLRYLSSTSPLHMFLSKTHIVNKMDGHWPLKNPCTAIEMFLWTWHCCGNKRDFWGSHKCYTHIGSQNQNRPKFEIMRVKEQLEKRAKMSFCPQNKFEPLGHPLY